MTKTNEPRVLTAAEWEELAFRPDVAKYFEVEDRSVIERATWIAEQGYAAVFHYTAGDMSYSGDLYVLFGDFGKMPLGFCRDADGDLRPAE